jgi:enterobactin synthetase component D
MRPSLAFELTLEHGLCIAVRLPGMPEAAAAMAQAVLREEERALAATLGEVRRRTWVGGRVALRLALERTGVDAPAVLADDRGAPALPSGVAGSISHKDELAVALVAREGSARLGVDVESDVARPIDISSKVLGADELQEIADLAAAERAREVLLRFSAKESIYKALDPFVRRYVGFHEVSVTPRVDGTAEVRQRLSEGASFAIDVRWRRLHGVVLTTARVEVV